MSTQSPVRRRAGRLASGGVIREAAARLFLERGYQGTSMEDIAAAARISKQTIYTHFQTKEELFADLVLGNVARVDEFVDRLPAIIGDEPGLEAGLGRLARKYAQLVGRSAVLSLRRLVVAEATRFPALARAYYERVVGRTLEGLAGEFARLAAEGKLQVDDPHRAAQHFAWLCVGGTIDRGMFYPDEPVAAADLDLSAQAAVRVFLAAYRAAPAASGASE